MILLSLIAQSRLPEISPAFFSSWIAVFLLLGGLIVMVLSGFAMSLTILEKLKAKKTPEVTLSQDPLRMKKVEELATRSELAAMAERIEADLEEVKSTAAETVKSQHEEVVAIHKRINSAVEVLDFIRGQLDGIVKNQALIMTKIFK